MHQPTVMIVDDEPANIEVLAAVLESDYEVRFAMSGMEALSMVGTQPGPDVILLDVLLPDVDGYEVCAKLRERADIAGVPIIFVTALSDPMAEAKGLEAGAVDYITKPFSPAIVRARVRNHLEMKQAREQLQHLAVTDPLTGLSNRRHFDEALAQEVQRHTRHNKALSLILIDIDYFKRFNDEYGHPGGDECLRRVAGAISSVLKRPADLVARIGGEEFACLLPETDASGAIGVAQGVCDAVHDLAIPHIRSNVGFVTVSVGVATTVAAEGISGSQLYAEADANLYKAKLQGRNRVWP